MPRKLPPNAEHISESAVLQTPSPAFRLDKEKCILYGAKLVNWTGAKGRRRYSRRAVEAAASRAREGYNNAKVYLDHAKFSPTDMNAPVRNVESLFARVKDPVINDEGAFGNIHYNGNHAWAKPFEWLCENDPEAIGLSHDAILVGPHGADGIHDIVDIPRVFSVDLVTTPGSTRSLREDASHSGEAVAQDTEEYDGNDDANAEGNEGHVSAGIDMQSVNGDDLSESLEHLSQYIAACVKDPALDAKAKIAKIKKALTLLEDSQPMEDSDDETSEDTEELEMSTEKPAKPTKATESDSGIDVAALQSQIASLTAENKALRAQEQAREDMEKAIKFCETAKLPKTLMTATFLNRLVERGQESWEEEVADRKLQVGGTQTTSRGKDEGNTVKGGAAFANYLQDAYKTRS